MHMLKLNNVYPLFISSVQIVPIPIGLVNFLVSRDLFKDIIDKVNYLYENF